LQRPEAPAAALSRKFCPANTGEQQQEDGAEKRGHGILLEGALFSWKALVDSSKYHPSLQVAARILAPQKSVASNATQSAADSPSGSDASAFDVGPLSLALPAGGIVGIVGPVGCGKSTFIMGLLGELQNQHQRQHGSSIKDEEAVACGGAPIGYLSQNPAVVNGSLRQNVTLGMAYDAERYTAAVEAACLGPDIAGMPAGDMTEIGEVRRLTS
jgi:ABC-type transport system involved in cytochrome bd biosynthesis fused ATPase/permease subunit